MFDDFAKLDLIDDGFITIPKHLESAFIETASIVKVKRGQTFMSKSDESTSVYLIDSGRIEFTLYSVTAKETLYRECGPGELIGELAAVDESPRSMNAVAVEDSTLFSLSRNAFLSLIDANPEFRSWFMSLLVGRIRDLSHRILVLTTLTVPCRVWLELLQRCEQVSSDEDCVTLNNFPVHRKLAAKLGTHREAISREFSLLTKDGLIKQQGRQLEVCSVSRLRRMIIRHLGD